ncbi:MAG: response regulator [Mobilitalea sp.]
MEKYKVLVADDEYIIRRGIVKLLKKHEELEVVAEAEDGEQALEMAQKDDIAIFFVDINMPLLNGLAFIEQLKQIRPKAVVNIITGYDKFEYVRQALRMGVFEYILKPLNEEAFHQTIHRILSSIGKDKEEENYLNWMKTTLEKNKSNYIGEFLDKCLLLHYNTVKIRDEMSFLGLELPSEYMLQIIHLSQTEILDIRKNWSDSLLYSSAENIAREIYQSLTPLYTGRNAKGNLILISSAKEKLLIEAKNLEYKKVVEKYLPVKVMLLQQTGKEESQIAAIYQELMTKLEEIKSYPSIIKETKSFIENNYYRADLSLNDAAEYVKISPQHLSRIFKKEMDITFIDFLTNIRIERAAQLLEDDSIKMYEVAETVGYSSQHYFSSVFKKARGVSPVEYRNQIKVNLKEKSKGNLMNILHD